MQPALEIRFAAPDLLAVQLGDAVDELVQHLRVSCARGSYQVG